MTTGEVRQIERAHTVPDIEAWFFSLLERAQRWVAWRVRHDELRDRSLASLAFPLRARDGQRVMMDAVTSAIREGRRLYVQAPTGSGKTIATLYPALKAMGTGKVSQIAFLTAKTMTRGPVLESLDLLRQPNQSLMVWDDVQGADKKVALIADVYTANAKNNPDKSVLFEGVGLADEIYVIVEIEGCLYIARGAVLSYREFTQPMDLQRLTDEEWQKQLEQEPRKGVPDWMKSILVPMPEGQKPELNEEFFYSSGC
jgi:hypothetical protein